MIAHAAKVASAEMRLFDLKDDLLQEIYLKLPEILDKWDKSKGTLDGYIYGYAKNILRTLVRERERFSYFPDGETSEVPDEDEDSISVTQYGIDESIAEDIDINRALDRIKKRLQESNANGFEIAGLANKSKATEKQSHGASEIVTRLDAALSAAPISKAEIARRVGISPQLLNAYIKGKTKNIPIDILDRIWAVLDEMNHENHV